MNGYDKSLALGGGAVIFIAAISIILETGCHKDEPKLSPAQVAQAQAVADAQTLMQRQSQLLAHSFYVQDPRTGMCLLGYDGYGKLDGYTAVACTPEVLLQAHSLQGKSGAYKLPPPTESIDDTGHVTQFGPPPRNSAGPCHTPDECASRDPSVG